jgi:hypothetical protein
MEALEFLDEASFLASTHDEEPTLSSNEEPSGDDGVHDQVNSLLLGTNDIDTDDVPSSYDVISCIHDNVGYYLLNDPWTNSQDAMQILLISDSLSTHQSIKRVDHDLIPQVQVDGGADCCITPHRHGFCLPNPALEDKTHINDAGVHAH